MNANGASAAIPEPTTEHPSSTGRWAMGVRAQLASSAVTEAISFIVAIAVSIIVNRALQPEGKGMLSATLNVVSIAFIAANFSLSKSFLYFFNREGITKRSVMGAAICLLPIGTILGLAVVVVGVWSGSIGNSLPLLLLTAALLLAQQWQDIIYGSLRAVRAIHSLNLAKTLQQCVRLAIVATLFALGSLTFPAALATELAAQVACIALLLWFFSGRRELYPEFQNTGRIMQQVVSYGILYQLFSISWTMHLKLDVVLLRSWAGPEETGLYSTAVNLADLISRLPTLLLFVTSPYIAQLRTDRESLAYATRVCRIAFPIFVLGALVMGIVAPWLVVLLFGQSYAAAATPLRIILPGTIFAGMFMLVVSYLVVKGHFKPLLVVQAAGLVLNIALNTVLIPRYSASGAAVASVISYAFCLLCIGDYLCRFHQMRWRDMFILSRQELLALVSRRRNH